MKVALTIFPTFSDKSIPLGLACINGALREAGHDVDVFDFDFAMSVDLTDLYYKVHSYAWEGDPHVVNYLGGSNVDLILQTVLSDDGGREGLAQHDPTTHEDVRRIQTFVEDAVRRMLANQPDQVWFSTFVSNMWLSMLAARTIRRLSPETRIGFGGPAIFSTQIQRFLLLNQIVDYCFVGEGEVTAVEFASRGEVVDGMAALMDDEHVFRPRPLALRLGDLPRPDFSGFPFPGSDVRAYLRRSFHGIPVFFSRGCVQKCAFCAERNIWQRFRTKKPAAIVEELIRYRRQYGMSLFYSCDSLVNFTAEWLEELCDRILDAELDCAFSFAFAIGSRLPKHLAQKMARVGFTRLYIGAEHGSQPMLDRMQKGTDADEIVQVTRDTVEAGLSVQLGTIVNFPGETAGDILDEIALFKRIDDTLLAGGTSSEQLPQRTLNNHFRLEPGTAMLGNPEQFGVVLSPVPSPFAEDRPAVAEVLVRWDYAEPQDAEFHRYLASRFGNQTERWFVPGHLSMRMARCLQDFLSDNDVLGLAPGVVVVAGPDGGGMVRMKERVMPLNRMMYTIMKAVSGGTELRRVRATLGVRYEVSPAMLRKFAALFFLEQVLEFREIAPRASRFVRRGTHAAKREVPAIVG